MARYVPHALLIALSTVAFLLWHLHIYPFSEAIFSYEGYAMHFFGGILWTAIQVGCASLEKSKLLLRGKVLAAHAIFAFLFLLAFELAQFFVPSRHVQWEDVAAQTAGIALTLLILLHTKTHRPP